MKTYKKIISLLCLSFVTFFLSSTAAFAACSTDATTGVDSGGTGLSCCSTKGVCSIGYRCAADATGAFTAALSESGYCIVDGSGSSENNATGGALCNAYKIVTGNIGRGVAVFSVVALGIFFFMGKVSWTLALSTALGIGALFGAPAVAGILTGKTFNCS